MGSFFWIKELVCREMEGLRLTASIMIHVLLLILEQHHGWLSLLHFSEETLRGVVHVTLATPATELLCEHAFGILIRNSFPHNKKQHH